jgi:hypothetical protein
MSEEKYAIDLFEGITSKRETLPMNVFHSAVNPRQKESYAPQKMAGDIAECGFRILNRPIVTVPNAAFRKKLGIDEAIRLILQGHRRLAGWAYLGEHFTEFGLNAEQAKMFQTVEVDTLFGLTEEQCREFALDEKYKVNLKAWEVALLLSEQIGKVGAVNANASELATNFGKLILESRLVPNGPSKLPKILNIENRRKQNEAFIKEARNGVNYVLYASKLGPWFVDQAILYLKYTRDGVHEPDNSKLVIKPNWEKIAGWHKNHVNDKDTIWYPVDDVELAGDAKSPTVKKVHGGPKGCEVWIEQEVRGTALGDKPSKKVGLTNATKEKLEKHMESDFGKAFVQLIVKGEDSLAEIAALDERNRAFSTKVKFLEENMEKLPKPRQTLAQSIIDDVDPGEFAKVWLVK